MDDSSLDPAPRPPPRRQAPEAIHRIAFFVVAMAVLVPAMAWRMGPELLDDGAFFLRYAENLTAGEPWVWNLGEPPVWGASAPLYPFILAVPLALGLPVAFRAQWQGELR